MANVTQADVDRLTADLNTLAARIRSAPNRKALYDIAARVNGWTVTPPPEPPKITATVVS